jgi:ferredoxin
MHRFVRRWQVTRDFWRRAREAGHSPMQFLHGYVYGRWPYFYIGTALSPGRLVSWMRPILEAVVSKASGTADWAASYHGKVMPTEAATRLIQVNEPVDMTVPEQIIPFDTARHLVLTEDQAIVALDCPCRAAREDPCLPLDVCLVIGEPFARFVLEHHPRRARAITPAEAIEILEAEAARGHVHHAFFKEAMLERFYAICNCCSCCCGAMSAHRSGVPMVISSGYVARVSEEACAGCGLCAERCPFDAIQMADGLARVDMAACMGCGVCGQSCPCEAVHLARDASKPAPLEPAPA